MNDEKDMQARGQDIGIGLIGLRAVLENGHYRSMDIEDSAAVYSAAGTYLLRIGKLRQEEGAIGYAACCETHLKEMASTFDIMGLKMPDGTPAAQSADYESPISKENPLKLFGLELQGQDDAAELAKGVMESLRPVDLAYRLDEIGDMPDDEARREFLGFYPHMDSNVTDAALTATGLAGYDMDAFALTSYMLGNELNQGVRNEDFGSPDLVHGATTLCAVMKEGSLPLDSGKTLDTSDYGTPENMHSVAMQMQEDAFTASMPELEDAAKKAAAEARLSGTESSPKDARKQMTGPEFI